MSTPGLNEPFPSRDPLVDKQGYPSFDFTRWIDQSLLPRVDASAVSVDAVSEPGANDGVTITPIGTNQLAGKYRFSIYLQVVTPAGVSSALQVTLTWTYGGVVQTEVFGIVAGNLVTTHQGVSFTFDIDAPGPVSYTIAYASNPANAMVYGYSLCLELVKAA